MSKNVLIFMQKSILLMRLGVYLKKMIAPNIYGVIARKYGFNYIDKYQQLSDGISIYPSRYCGGSLSEISKANYVIHCCAGSWRDYGKIKSFVNKI